MIGFGIYIVSVNQSFLSIVCPLYALSVLLILHEFITNHIQVLFRNRLKFTIQKLKLYKIVFFFFLILLNNSRLSYFQSFLTSNKVDSKSLLATCENFFSKLSIKLYLYLQFFAEIQPFRSKIFSNIIHPIQHPAQLKNQEIFTSSTLEKLAKYFPLERFKIFSNVIYPV